MAERTGAARLWAPSGAAGVVRSRQRRRAAPRPGVRAWELEAGSQPGQNRLPLLPGVGAGNPRPRPNDRWGPSPPRVRPTLVRTPGRTRLLPEARPKCAQRGRRGGRRANPQTGHARRQYNGTPRARLECGPRQAQDRLQAKPRGEAGSLLNRRQVRSRSCGGWRPSREALGSKRGPQGSEAESPVRLAPSQAPPDHVRPRSAASGAP